jgi:hypothetical protein
MSLYSSGNLTLPSLPSLPSPDGKDSSHRKQHSTASPNAAGFTSPTRNKRTNYLFAPDAFVLDEYTSLGKKKSSFSNSMHSPTASSAGISASHGLQSQKDSFFGDSVHYSSEEWDASMKTIDSHHSWESETNPLVISEQLLTLPTHYLVSLGLLLFCC